MTAAALLLALVGIGFSFFSAEILSLSGLSLSKASVLLFQLLGALYFGFAMLNWMAKGNVIGGIYNRPIVIANFAHFLIGGFALMKSLMKYPELPWAIWTVGGLYIIFALFFGMVFFGSPVSKKESIAVN